jgi:hypothetical protein
VLRLDAGKGLVEVQASAHWSSLAGHLRPSAAEIAELWAGSPTIGASVAANAPGPDGRPTVVHVEALTLVTPDGELRRVSRDNHAALFAQVVGGHGLFGVPYSITLRLESLAQAAANASPTVSLQLSETSASARALQLLVPPESLDAFMAEARSRCAEWRVAIEGVEVCRTLAEEETQLRWARREYASIRLTLAQPPALGGAVRATQLRRELIDIAISHGGSFPIACTSEASRAQMEHCYPEIRTFLAEKRRMDPAEKLSNDWYRHVKSVLGRETCDVKWAK